MSTTNPGWFTELMESAGTGFSLSLAEQGKVHEVQSPFQKIEVYETQTFGRLMVIDGCVMLTSRDNFLYHEMMIHPALFTHPNPKRVVIIGGGDCGSLKEALKHPGVERVTQIDIDEQVTRVSEIYFPELCDANSDSRAELLFDDGIKWMKEAEPGSVDVVIIDSTDPVGPGEVLFTEEFYRYCANALADGGLLVQQSESPLVHLDNIIAPMHQRLRNIGFAETRLLSFPQPVYPTGWWSATLASKGVMPELRAEEIATKPFATRYYNLDVHRGALAQPEFVREVLG